jgi:hypothetical protein
LEKAGRIALKTILWIIGSVLFLILLIFVLIQVPAVQNFVKDKAVTFLQNKIHTKVKIGHISLGFPKLLELDSVYFEDQKRDTLLAGDQLRVDISMLKLLHHVVEVNEIDLKGITANVKKNKDSVFNFDYIVKAFASEQKKPVKPEDTTSTMKFSVGKIKLDKIKIGYSDATNGNSVNFFLGHFDTDIKDFDMDKMKFNIPKITLSEVNARIVQTPSGSAVAKAATVDTATKPINMTLKLGIIDLSKINVDYRTNEMAATVNLGKFLVEMNKLDLKNQIADISNITLSNTKASLTFAKPQTVKKAVVKTAKKIDTLVAKAQSGKGWAAVLRKFTLDNDDIKFDNNAQKPISKGMDYAHMHIHGLNADLENLAYNPDTISGKINNISFAEKSGLDIKKFHTAFFYGPHNAYLNNLYLETPQTVIQRRIEVGYPSLANISKDLGQIRINADLNGSRLGLRDILLVMPTMSSMEPFKSSPNDIFRINGRVIGKVNDLSIPSLEISGLSNTHIKASANLKGLPDMNKAYFDVNIANLNTSRRDISKLVAANMIPSNISVPESLNLKGNFKGTMKVFNTKMTLRSSYGAVDLTAAMNGSRKGHETYSANIKTSNFNVGALTKQPQTVGSITLSANVKGVSLDPKKASLQFNGDIASAYVKGYTYKDLVLKGTASNGSYTAIARMADPNIHFSMDAKANMNKKYPSVYTTLTVDSIDFQRLHLSSSAMRFHGKMVANVPTANPDYLNANIKATDLLLVDSNRRIKLDTVSLVSTANADSSSLRLKTPMLGVHMVGQYKLTQLGDAMQDFINKYYNQSMANAKKKPKAKYSPQKFSFGITFVRTPMVADFVPDLKQMSPVIISGRFDSQAEVLTVNGSIPKVLYGTDEVNNAHLAINTQNNALNYSFTADNIKASSSVNLLYPSITGSAQNDKLNLNVQIRDAAKKVRFKIAGVFSVLQNGYQFSFLQNGLILNYDQWTVSGDNAIQFGNRGILAKDFAISNKGQQLSINSSSQQMNSPIDVTIKNFQIDALARAAQQDSLQVGGTINGQVRVSNFEKSPVFTAGLKIGNFSFKGDTVGNIAINVNNQTQNAYAASVGITGGGNQVNLKGMYYTSPSSRFDLTLDIVRLRMKSIEGFSFGSIRNAKGNLTGQLRITGTTGAPEIIGDVNFNQVGFNVSMLNSYFTMPDDKITFNGNGIDFNTFTLVDSTGNKAVLTGQVLTKTYTDFRFALKFHADNFRVMNSTKDNNKLFYGKLFINADANISGDMNSPKVDATLAVNDKTDMTIVLPQSDPEVEDRNGVVQFINPNAPKTDSIMLARQVDSLRKVNASGMDVSANIRVNRNAKFTMVIDEVNGDVVHLQGQAQLNGGIDPSGKTNLTGTYTVETGSYDLSYATVKRKFTFKKGSTITWTGDPTSANINLTAVYIARVPPIDLVSNQLAGTDNQTMYKEPLPFNVDLILKNELLKPDISFDIVLPDSTYMVTQDVVNTVDARLAQVRTDPNELNKQVLGVLVLGHFIGDNPLQSQGGGTSLAGQVRNSVSGLLTDQLNRLAGSLISGVDLNFGLTSGTDYSSGSAQNRTDLNVGLSKRFLNDRLTVSVGNNFSLEGTQPGEKQSNIAGNVSVGYKLSKDGRYTLRAYRVDQYEVIEGQVIETGVAFTLTVDYNRFSQIFSRSTKKERELEKEYRKQQKEKKKEEKAKDEAPQQAYN